MSEIPAQAERPRKIEVDENYFLEKIEVKLDAGDYNIALKSIADLASNMRMKGKPAEHVSERIKQLIDGVHERILIDLADPNQRDKAEIGLRSIVSQVYTSWSA